MHGRDLRAIANGTLTDRRELIFGEQGQGNTKGDTGDKGHPRYILTRPGLLGVCEDPYQFTDDKEHLHPCRQGADDCTPGSADLGDCIYNGHPTDAAWKRCVNWPGKRCASDADCAGTPLNLCGTGSTCEHDDDGRSFKDFDGQACTSHVDCVPPGVCQPIIIKAQQKDTGGINEAWDVAWDPDQRESLRRDDFLSPIEAGSLGSALSGCIQNFAALNTGDRWFDDEDCPSSLADWR